MVARRGALRKTDHGGGGLWRLRGTAESGVPDLDRLIHERMRLGIVSALAVNESLTFN
jgi:hypothetical protein